MSVAEDQYLAERRAQYAQEFGGIEAEHRRNLAAAYVGVSIVDFVCGVLIRHGWHPIVTFIFAIGMMGMIKQAQAACDADTERRMALGIE